MPAWLIGLLRFPLTRYVIVAAAAALWAYPMGRKDCALKQARLASEAQAEAAERTREADIAESEKSAQAARRRAEDARSIEEIVRDAGMENGSAECLDADTVERLRKLQ